MFQFLLFIKHINFRSYEAVDPVVAKSAHKAFRNHTWYLAAEMLPLALYDKNLSDVEKAKLAQKILEQPKDCENEEELQYVGRHGTDYGKPDLMAVNVNAESLSDLVTPASWRFFKILGFSSDFLGSPPDEWELNRGYEEASAQIAHFKVTNEDAERSVKLCADFLGVSKKEETFQNYLQVIEDERVSTPDIRKYNTKCQETNK